MDSDIERLTQAAIKQLSKDHPYEYADLMYDSVMTLDGHFDIEKVIRAILAELRKPSERMLSVIMPTIDKCYHGVKDDPGETWAGECVWQAMIDSITDEDGEPDE